MNNNTTNKKKLELKKTAIANLTLSEAQMKMLIGGKMSGDDFCLPEPILTQASKMDNGNTACTTQSNADECRRTFKTL